MLHDVHEEESNTSNESDVFCNGQYQDGFANTSIPSNGSTLLKRKRTSDDDPPEIISSTILNSVITDKLHSVENELKFNCFPSSTNLNSKDKTSKQGFSGILSGITKLRLLCNGYNDTITE